MGHHNTRPPFLAALAELPGATIFRECGLSRFDENWPRLPQAN